MLPGGPAYETAYKLVDAIKIYTTLQGATSANILSFCQLTALE